MIIMKVGTRLLKEREDRKLSQAQMADIIGVSAATYSRLERNETSIELDKIVDVAKKLNIPFAEFLPENIMINGDNKNSQNAQGLVLGNIYNYNYSDKENAQLVAEKDKENNFLKEENLLLKKRIKDLEEMNELLKNKQHQNI